MRDGVHGYEEDCLLMRNEHFALESVRVPEEHAERCPEVVDFPICRPGLDEPVADDVEGWSTVGTC